MFENCSYSKIKNVIGNEMDSLTEGILQSQPKYLTKQKLIFIKEIITVKI